MTEKTRKKISDTLKRKGIKPPSQLGCRHTNETKDKMSKSRRGHKVSQETRNSISLANTGKTRSIETKTKLSKATILAYQEGRKSKIQSEEHKRKVGLAHKGEKSNFWKGGTCSAKELISHSFNYRQWRNEVYKRDKFTCMTCGNVGGKLHAHHIRLFSELLQEAKKLFPELPLYDAAMLYEPLWDTNNGITECEDCHEDFHKELYKIINMNKIIKIA